MSRPNRFALAAVLAVVLGLLVGGCATGRADAGAANPTLSWSAGVLSFERADVVRTEVSVTDWPVGMDRWTPEQMAAFVQARGAAGNPGNVGDLFYSRQDVKVGTDQQGGTASPTNETPVRVDANIPTPAKGAAEVAAEALGLGGTEKPKEPEVESEEPPVGDQPETPEPDEPLE